MFEAPDEAVVFIVAAGLSVIAAWRWYWPISRITSMASRASVRRALSVWPLLLLGLLMAILVLFASPDVRDSPMYLTFYGVFGMAWLGLVTFIAPLLGLSHRDDVLERGNSAAAPAILGLATGWMLAFAGGNIGEGPGWWVVLFCAILTSITLIVVWIVLQLTSHINESITIERDGAAGWRFGGLMAAAGLIAGRAAAGDCVSVEATVADYITLAWPVVALLGFAIGLETLLRPRPERRPASPFLAGVVPAVALLGLAAIWVIAAGPWS